MRSYGDDIFIIGVTGALMLAIVAAGRGIVVFASAIGWL